MTDEYISITETAKLVRAALKRHFPETRFSVHSDRYAGGASIHVAWIDGPPRRAVEPIARQFKGADFDGMIDLKTYHTSWLAPDGSAIIAKDSGTEGSKGSLPAISNEAPPGARLVHFGADFIFCNRQISENHLAAYRAHWRGLDNEARFRAMVESRAENAAHVKPTSWRLDDELTDFGTQSLAVFRWMALYADARELCPTA